MTTEYLPETTIRYKTFVKNTLVGAIDQVFEQHPDPILQRTRAGIEWSKDEADYPRVVVRFYEREIFNAGVAHEEVLHIQGESDSVEVEVTLPASGGQVQLQWSRIQHAVAYRVYRGLASDQQNTYFEVMGTSFIDAGGLGTSGRVPDIVTAAVDTPLPEATVLPPSDFVIQGRTLQPGVTIEPDPNTLPGFLPGGNYFYRVTALVQAEAVNFQHYFYSADIELAVYALSSLDRDLIADTLVQMIAMGTLEDYTNRFYERIYPTQELYPDSFWNFISVNSDQIQGFGENDSQVPWGAEDDLLYSCSYRVGVFGEIYSLPPKLSFALVQQIFLYPYLRGQPAPSGNPDDDTPWVSNAMPD